MVLKGDLLIKEGISSHDLATVETAALEEDEL